MQILAAHIWNSLQNELRTNTLFKEFGRLIRTWEGTSCKCSMCKFNFNFCSFILLVTLSSFCDFFTVLFIFQLFLFHVSVILVTFTRLNCLLVSENSNVLHLKQFVQ